jgi:hypothetical protein
MKKLKNLLRAWWFRQKYSSVNQRALLLNYKSNDLRRPLEKLEVIRPQDFKDFPVDAANDLKFTGVHETIGEYSAELARLLTLLENDKALDNLAPWVYDAARPMELGRWLTRSGSYYIDSAKALETLLPLLRSLFLWRMQEGAEGPFRSYNERLLYNTIQGAQSLVDTLAVMHMRCLSK